MPTIHLILNAHLDPVWLWPWPGGLDALLATCRTACDVLDAWPEAHFCKGEAWGYDLIERVAPRLFERIKQHVAAGRWHIVGGWWIQPDCNGPGAVGLTQQIATGRAYFESRFEQLARPDGRPLGAAIFPRAAHNVDTFGHAATLPGILRAGGQDRYVMMRPQEHELTLPARVFRWRGAPDGPEVTVFRIAGGYAVRDMSEGHLRAALSDLPPGVTHTMCFVGLGDHGGGPTHAQMQWLREHRDVIPGCRLEFSWPDRFFDAIEAEGAPLPLVTGELQMHAVGCYSVGHALKVQVRAAEEALDRAGHAGVPHPFRGGRLTRTGEDVGERLHTAWRQVCFAHFHDIYGGTCIPSAYPQVLAQLGAAMSAADELLQLELRRRMEALPDDLLQRIVLWNADATTFDGYVAHEAWFEHVPFQPSWHLLDESGERVPFQVLHPEALLRWEYDWYARLLFRVRLAPGEIRTLRIAPAGDVAAGLPPGRRRPPANAPAGSDAALDRRTPNVEHRLAFERLRPSGSSAATFPPGARLVLLDDPTDTWSHGVDRFGGPVRAVATWGAPVALESGPLLTSIAMQGQIGSSALRAEWRQFASVPYTELELRVAWQEHRRVLKLEIPLATFASQELGDEAATSASSAAAVQLVAREDGIPGGALARPADGRECPIRDRIRLRLADGRQLGVVCPEAFAADVTPTTLRLTLLRSPLMAHHEPYAARPERGTYADWGPHTFRVQLWSGTSASFPTWDGATLDTAARQLQRPPLTADLTRGMPRA
jgi:alpha-mannosidase